MLMKREIHIIVTVVMVMVMVMVIVIVIGIVEIVMIITYGGIPATCRQA